jgi:hypothetical protein
MQRENASALFLCAAAGEELLEELPWVLVVDEATLATLGEPPPPQPATTRARDTRTAIPTVELAQPSPLRGVSSAATRTSEEENTRC